MRTALNDTWIEKKNAYVFVFLSPFVETRLLKWERLFKVLKMTSTWQRSSAAMCLMTVRSKGVVAWSSMLQHLTLGCFNRAQNQTLVNLSESSHMYRFGDLWQTASFTEEFFYPSALANASQTSSVVLIKLLQTVKWCIISVFLVPVNPVESVPW